MTNYEAMENSTKYCDSVSLHLGHGSSRKSKIMHYFHSMMAHKAFNNASDLIHSIQDCTQERSEEKINCQDDYLGLLEDVIETVIIMHEDNFKAQKVLSDFNGHLCKISVPLIEQIKSKAPKCFGARVADFNENLFYEMQERDSLRKLFENCDCDEECHVSIEKSIQDFEKVISDAIGCRMSNMIYQGSFMKTDETQPQPAHVDFNWDTLDDFKQQLFIAFFPLTKEGMFLQVWNDKSKSHDENGKVLFIPFGNFLILPSDTIHGGGFKAGDGGNLRFHMYIASDKNALPHFPYNRYTEKDDCSKELSDRLKDSPRLSNLIGDFFDV